MTSLRYCLRREPLTWFRFTTESGKGIVRVVCSSKHSSAVMFQSARTNSVRDKNVL